MSNLKIAAVIPLYNHVNYVSDAINSILKQDVSVDEIVLIDDGSTDGGFGVASEILREIPFARVFSQENAGAHCTLNRAIELCNSEYIAVLNSDDVFVRTKISRCHEIIRSNNNVGLIAGDIGIMDGKGHHVKEGVTIDWLQRSYSYLNDTNLLQLSLLNENFIATTSNMVFRKSLWQSSGGFQSLRYCHDLDFLMFAFLNSDVYYDKGNEHITYRVHDKNTIKENLSKIRIEIAAVMASTIFTSNGELFKSKSTAAEIRAFRKFIENKNISNLTLYFLAAFKNFKSRAGFYDHAIDQNYFEVFAEYL